MMPYGGFKPSISNFSGYLSGHSTHCLTWNLIASLPPISSQYTFGISTITSAILSGFDSSISASKSDFIIYCLLFLMARK